MNADRLGNLREGMLKHERVTWFQLVLRLLPLGLIFGAGTVGYVVIEGWPPLDAAYMTMITISTVGYGEPFPLSASGRAFTILLIIAAVITVGYAITSIATFIFEGELSRLIEGSRMDRRINNLKDHTIICGCGSTGRYIVEEFHSVGHEFVVIDNDPERLEDAYEHIGDFPYIVGDATKDDTLRDAGIERAKGLIAAVHDDKDNLFIVLSARAMNPTLRIITRGVDEGNTEKLLRAGANEVISPNAIGGMRMASMALRPSVVSFLDQMLRAPDQTLRMEEIRVSDVPDLSGETLGQSNIGQRTGMLVVAVIHEGGSYEFNPGASTVLHTDDILIVLGTPEQRDKLRRLTR